MLGLLSVRSWCNAVKLRLKSWIIGNSEMSRRDQPDSGAYEHLLEAGHRLVVDHVRAARHVVHCSAFASAQFGNLLFTAAAAECPEQAADVHDAGFHRLSPLWRRWCVPATRFRCGAPDAPNIYPYGVSVNYPGRVCVAVLLIGMPDSIVADLLMSS